MKFSNISSRWRGPFEVAQLVASQQELTDSLTLVTRRLVDTKANRVQVEPINHHEYFMKLNGSDAYDQQ